MLESLTITQRDSPTFEGERFGETGCYELLTGIAQGSVAPDHPRNARLRYIMQAPRTAQGRVLYELDVAILKPVELARGNGRLLCEAVNRGRKRILAQELNGGPRTNTPHTLEHAGTGFLQRRGDTVLWVGWQADLPTDGDLMGARYPVATDGGGPLTGRTREEAIDASGADPFVMTLHYPAATLSPELATLTVRQRETDPPVTPPGLAWRYLDERRVEITRPPGFDAGAIYAFAYVAKDPVVTGLAFAGMSDLVSWLRTEGSADNPLAEVGHSSVRKAYAYGISQCGRFIRDFLHHGFNADEQGRQVFDGLMPLIAGAKRTSINAPFAIPGQSHGQHEDHLSPGVQFPFTYPVREDPLTGRCDGLLARAQADGVVPKVMQIDSETELWQACHSLLTEDAAGSVDLPPTVRLYLMAGGQHTPANSMHASAAVAAAHVQQRSNPLPWGAQVRALLVALDAWCSDGTEPPPSRVPTFAEGTLVPPRPPWNGFPLLPGVTAAGLINQQRVLDDSVVPPNVGAPYPVYVNKTDTDGNGLGGIRPPHLQVPTGTHLGWNLRAAGHAENELAGIVGSYVPFCRSKAERLAMGDPRLSLEERYPSAAHYVAALREACTRLVAERFLLEEDAARILEEAEAKGIPGA